MKNREIKFRAWDNLTKSMINSVSIIGFREKFITNFSRKHIHNSMDWDSEEGFSYDYELMQFTGLKDKNGVEVYEGDILTFDPHEWNRATLKPESDWEFPFWEVEWNEKDAEWDLGGGTSSETSTYKEVVGNVHETPKLLK